MDLVVAVLGARRLDGVSARPGDSSSGKPRWPARGRARRRDVVGDVDPVASSSSRLKTSWSIDAESSTITTTSVFGIEIGARADDQIFQIEILASHRAADTPSVRQQHCVRRGYPLLPERFELRQLALDLGLDVERLAPHADTPRVGRLDQLAHLGDELRVLRQRARRSARRRGCARAPRRCPAASRLATQAGTTSPRGTGGSRPRAPRLKPGRRGRPCGPAGSPVRSRAGPCRSA